jgi:hypothetical protein
VAQSNFLFYTTSSALLFYLSLFFHSTLCFFTTTGLREGLLDLEKTLNSKFKFKIHELLFITIFKFSGYYSIHVTIQNTRYYLNLEYEQCTSTHLGVAQAPKSLPTIQALYGTLGGWMVDTG